MTLRDDIHADPACADALIARDCTELARIRSVSRTKLVPVSKPVFAIWCGSTGLRAAIEGHANNMQSPLCSLALTLRDFLGGPPDGFVDFTNAANQQALAYWESAGALTAAQLAQAIELGRVADPLDAQDVAAAVFNPDGSFK